MHEYKHITRVLRPQLINFRRIGYIRILFELRSKNFSNILCFCALPHQDEQLTISKSFMHVHLMLHGKQGEGSPCIIVG